MDLMTTSKGKRKMVKHPIKLPLLKASDSSRSRDHDRRMKSEICAMKEMSAVKLNQISEKTRSKFLLLVKILEFL